MMTMMEKMTLMMTWAMASMDSTVEHPEGTSERRSAVPMTYSVMKSAIKKTPRRKHCLPMEENHSKTSTEKWAFVSVMMTVNNKVMHRILRVRMEQMGRISAKLNWPITKMTK